MKSIVQFLLIYLLAFPVFCQSINFAIDDYCYEAKQRVQIPIVIKENETALNISVCFEVNNLELDSVGSNDRRGVIEIVRLSQSKFDVCWEVYGAEPFSFIFDTILILYGSPLFKDCASNLINLKSNKVQKLIGNDTSDCEVSLDFNPIAEAVLFQNIPNPFTSYTTLTYFLPRDGEVAFTFYSLQGRFLCRRIYQGGLGVNTFGFSYEDCTTNDIFVFDRSSQRQEEKIIICKMSFENKNYTIEILNIE